MTRPRVVTLAAASFIVYHIIVLAGLALVVIDRLPEHEPHSWMSFIGPAMFCLFPIGVAYELWRGREWGRRWLVRCLSPELIAFACAIELFDVHELGLARCVGYGAGLALSLLYAAWRWRMFFQLGAPEVRRYFTR